ncbi:hypothetical protein HIM_00974 [Hirsutella minnesotensis 3608]|nr:hypothetical protein HIM_00974 [Hirsutella minnesotensis 3608]
MNPTTPLTSRDPVPMASSPYAYSPSAPPPPSQPSQPGLGKTPQCSGLETQPDYRPLSAGDVPRPGPQSWTPVAQPVGSVDIRNVRASCLFGLREYVTLQHKRQSYDGSASAMDLESRIRGQANLVAGDLRTLHAEVRELVKHAENQRWRRWLLGGVIAAFIPAIRRIFRRGHDEHSRSSANDTEYAFKRSKSLMARIKDGVLGSSKLAKIAFFVFAVLFVFQNEVTLRAARTTSKRIKKLSERVERGDVEISEADLSIFEGWRWRVLLW